MRTTLSTKIIDQSIHEKGIRYKFGKFNHENDVLHDAHKVVYTINLKIIRRYWAFWAVKANSAMLALEVIQLKIVKLGWFLMWFRNIRHYVKSQNNNLRFKILIKLNNIVSSFIMSAGPASISYYFSLNPRTKLLNSTDVRDSRRYHYSGSFTILKKNLNFWQTLSLGILTYWFSR